MSDLQRPTNTDGAALLPTLTKLWPYIWPADRSDLKLRVIFATVLLFLAKFATIAVPYTFKWATDALAGRGTAPVAPNNWLAWAFAAPIVMTLAYGGTRIVIDATGNFQAVPSVIAFGMASEPYTFVVGADGKLITKFEGVTGQDELIAALTQAAGGG